MQAALETDIKIKTNTNACNECCICTKECAFLSKYGSPGRIIELYTSDPDRCLAISFECSLCGLCKKRCPKGVDAPAMFLRMRRRAFQEGKANFPEHRGILNYEKKGTSKRYTHYGLPENCRHVFFPGCTLPGTRPGVTWKAYAYLKKKIPDMGIVLDCCTKPSHDLGRQDYFQAMFDEMKAFLLEKGVREIIVACPNCHKIFSTYARELAVKTVYEIIAQDSLDSKVTPCGTVTVHDPCPVRFSNQVQDAVRTIVTSRGLKIIESSHTRSETLCCGEGGSVGCMAPELAQTWTQKRIEESKGMPVVTYCAGCAGFLSGRTRVFHVLDQVFEPARTLGGKPKVSKAPLTYLNRIRLKKKFQREDAAVTRERTLSPVKRDLKPVILKWAVLGLILATAVGIRESGMTRYMDTDKLRDLIQGFGHLAPLVYILIYTIAPALLLPGLPITIAGGILFGPLWGVVYTILGATMGAGLAFLVSRYVSSDFISSRLTGPKWIKLADSVEKNGWKVVAITRLIPIFPFNLLNYAFGLTRIRFSHYILTTFVCMLPGCIAFIVFSSSLLDLLTGKISAQFALGLAMIIIVALIPMIYNKTKKKGLL